MPFLHKQAGAKVAVYLEGERQHGRPFPKLLNCKVLQSEELASSQANLFCKIFLKKSVAEKRPSSHRRTFRALHKQDTQGHSVPHRPAHARRLGNTSQPHSPHATRPGLRIKLRLAAGPTSFAERWKISNEKLQTMKPLKAKSHFLEGFLFLQVFSHLEYFCTSMVTFS